MIGADLFCFFRWRENRESVEILDNFVWFYLAESEVCVFVYTGFEQLSPRGSRRPDPVYFPLNFDGLTGKTVFRQA